MMKKTPQSTRQQRSGMILVLVLVLLALITGLVIQSQLTARSILATGEQQKNKLQLQLALQHAARTGLKTLADDDNSLVDYLDEPWAQPMEYIDPTGISIWMKITDLDRFFDLNNLYIETPPTGLRPASDITMDIMTLCGDFSPVDRVHAIKDWIDPDQDGIKESDLYAQKTPPYACPNDWLQAWSDLLWIDGFSETYLNESDPYAQGGMFKSTIKENLTVIPVPRSSPITININTASKEVLLGVVGLENDLLVQQILALRVSRPLVSLDSIASGAAGINISAIRPWLDVTSHYFSIQVRAFQDTQSMELTAIVQRTQEGDVEILRWVY